MKSAMHRLPRSLLLLSSRLSSSKSSSTSSLLSYKHGFLSSSSSASSLLSYKHSYSSSSSADKYGDLFPSDRPELIRDEIDKHWSQVNDTKSLGTYYRGDSVVAEKPQYIHISNDSVEPISIWKGHHLDVISLLSTFSDHLIRIGPTNSSSQTDFIKAHELRGKYVLLFCALLPCGWEHLHSGYWRLISALYSELSQTRVGSYFEIVIVPMMSKEWDDDEGVFHHSLSAFPGCLAVPFTHKYRRDYICKSLNMEYSERLILVDHSHKVLEPHSNDMIKYGARGFPFTDEHMRSLRGEDGWQERWRSCNKTLSGLLSCESNPSFLLRNFDSEETISVEQLNKHLVGLYLFEAGDKLKSFHSMYQECRNQGLDFEIVLVCMPCCSAINPNDDQDVVLCAMKKHGVSNWWVFPFNNSAFHRLSNLSSKSSGDSMIIVGPHNKFVDQQGGDFVSIYGSHLGTQMYPFTMEALLQVFLQRLETITVESFLNTDYVYRDYKCDDIKRMPLSELKGKNFFVFFAFRLIIDLPWMPECLDLGEWYDIIKKKDSDFEVIFVPITLRNYARPTSETREFIFESKTKFLICPFDEPKHPELVCDDDDVLLSCEFAGLPKKGLRTPLVLAFGKDGRLLSLDAFAYLTEHGLDAYPSLLESRNSNLCNDITRQLLDEFPYLRENSTLSS